MVLKRNSVTKLASLSALGAGALALTTQRANANIVFTVVNQKVGWDTGFGTSYTSPTLGSGSADFKFSTAHSIQGIDENRKVQFGGQSLLFRAMTSSTHPPAILRVFGANKTWSGSTAGTQKFGNGLVAGVVGASKTRFPGVTGNDSFTDQYALFQFTSLSQTLYGWVELSLVAQGRGTAPFGPDLTIVSFAYDTTGAILAAGVTTESGAPEPATLATTGLAALVLGAAGLRRWRKARRA